MTSVSKELLVLRDVSKYYTSGQSVVMGLNSINLTFSAGEFVAITGESGSGKSTLSRVVAGILPYENGEMTVDGRPTSHYDGTDWEYYRGHSISFISQSYDILPGCTVMKNVVSALRLTGMDKAGAALRAEEILRQVELWEMKNRRAAKLSSGQKQRLSIARALAKPAPILIADEPTGNLDSENSAKIIALLAEAAKERLVLMVTHDFDEAAESATRRVILRDGVVVSDVLLRPANEVSTTPAVQRHPPKSRKGLGLYTARLQMASRPMWTAVMLIFFALSAFAVFAFLGTFIVNLDDSSTRIYDGTAFPNGDPERIVVVRQDGGEMTEEDYQALLALENVETLERYGYLTDLSYYYREEVDLTYHYNSVVVGLGEVVGVTRDVTLLGSGLYLKTVPGNAGEGDFLTAGRLPETVYEVVAKGDESMLGQRFPLYIKDTKKWNKTSYLLFTVEVVGVTDRGEDLYFSDALGRTLTQYAMPDERVEEINGESGLIFLPYSFESMIDERLLEPADGVTYQLPDYYMYRDRGEPGDTVKVENRYFSTVMDNPKWPDDYVAVPVANWTVDFLTCQKVASSGSFRRATHIMPFLAEESDIAITYHEFYGKDCWGYHPSTYLNSITIPAQRFDTFVSDSRGDQVSLFITDFAYTERVLAAVEEAGYYATSPYLWGTTKVDETLAAERMQTLKVCLLALLAAILLQIVALRAMFSVETEEFRLLADIGLDRKTARRSVLWQILCFAVCGQILAAVAVILCGQLGVERIVSVLHYLPAPYVILISAVHFAAGLITALWIMGAVRRQVYPFTGRRPDLNMDGLEEEVSP